MLTMQRRQFVTLAVLCLCGLSAQSLVFAAEGVPAERRLPPGTTVFFSIPDAVEAHERAMSSSFGQLLQDDAFVPIWEDISDWWDEISEQVESELGLLPEDLIHLIHGELAFAVVQPPGKDLGGVLFLEFGDHRSTVDTLLEKVQESMEEQAERSVETIEDTEVTSYLFEEGEGSGSLAYFIKDQYFVAAMAGANASAGLLEEILIRWDGEHDQTFADEEVYSEVMLKCQTDGEDEPQIRWYFSPIDLFRAAATLPQATRGPVSPAMILRFLPVLGVDKFKAVGGTSTMMTDEFDSVTRTFLAVDQPISGVLKIFEFPATNQQPPRWVPSTASGYSSINWDVEGAYKAVEALVDFFQPPGTLATSIDQFSQIGPQVHVKDDVIDAITGRVQILGELRDNVELENAAAQPMVLAIELSNEERMTDVLERVVAALDESLEAREFRDFKIYETEVPNFGGGPPQSMGVAIARGQLFFTTDVELLEGYLRDEGVDETLANSSDYRRVASHFPSRTSMLSFQRPAAQIKPYYEMLRSGNLAAVFSEIDFSKLPEFDQIAHYFNLTGSYAVPDEGGALFINFGLHSD